MTHTHTNTRSCINIKSQALSNSHVVNLAINSFIRKKTKIIVHLTKKKKKFEQLIYTPREGLDALVVSQDLRCRGRGHGRHEERVPQPVLRHPRLKAGPVVSVRRRDAPQVELKEAFRGRGPRVRLVGAQLTRELYTYICRPRK